MRAIADRLPRHRTRRALLRRLSAIEPHPDQEPAERRRATLEAVRSRAALASATARLNRADLPIEFWRSVLGARMSGASAIWPRWAKDIDRAEVEWLQVVAERAELAPGQRVLELGASLGAVARWAEDELPGLDTTLGAADPRQRLLLQRVVAASGTQSAKLLETPLSDGTPEAPFDRILVLEALSAFSNPIPLLHRLVSWLAPGGRLLLQASCHWRSSYHFQPKSESRWLFDTPAGALMPGEEFFAALAGELPILDRWELSGEHLERTVRAWRLRMEQNSGELRSILSARGDARAARTLETWRSALLAQQTMYGFRNGQEWGLTQYLMGDENPQSF